MASAPPRTSATRSDAPSRSTGHSEPLHLQGFFKPSDGLEPSTPSLPSSNERGTAGKTGKPRARIRNRPKTSNPPWTRLPALVFPQFPRLARDLHAESGLRADDALRTLPQVHP